ncbi:hypothetical protein RN607_09640 [Demequina capsici]|uniref:Uncharacterized protein n=1 Tax=Demequina capsici TaxID=3075620 RepID=A0AA96J732_9MICO|nr:MULTISPECIES: hypothetical protein [unclassified Demequina]WNM23623.1 hypothetical protein RN606_09640 [Demequina sp. OYTSA14]WNM26461.1 hypothetical protein RN607_09640 [Demequina sp. PMTSA13]
MALIDAQLVDERNAIEEPLGPVRYRAELWTGAGLVSAMEAWDLIGDDVTDAVAWLDEKVAARRPCRGVLSVSYALTAGGTKAPNPIATQRIYEKIDAPTGAYHPTPPAPGFFLRAVGRLDD